MTPSTPTPPLADPLGTDKYWWRHLSGYHWFVFFVASFAWFFDCLDQRIFSLARIPALNALRAANLTREDAQNFGKIVTAFFLIGWGIGGMIFGSLGDRFGRAKTLAVCIAIFASFSGLCFFSRSWYDFGVYRFLTGLGVGGVFGLAVALIAETVPAIARTQALGLLQILSAVGNITASLVLMGMTVLETHKVIPAGQTWRYMFLVEPLPALVLIFLTRFIREPEAWLRLKESGQLAKGGIFASYGKLFRQKKWQRNLIVGSLIASTGVVGLWAIGEYAVDLQNKLFTNFYSASAPLADVGIREAQIQALVNNAKANAFLFTQIGAVVGMWLFTRLAMSAGRRLAFFVGFTSALIVTVLVYWKMQTPADAYWMMPLMGAAQLGVFAGFSIYLPELFPSGLRGTGTSFCYNLGRFAAAGGSFFSAMLSQGVYGKYPTPLPLRYSAMTMCAIFLVGLAALPFAPETRGKPLPED